MRPRISLSAWRNVAVSYHSIGTDSRIRFHQLDNKLYQRAVLRIGIALGNGAF